MGYCSFSHITDETAGGFIAKTAEDEARVLISHPSAAVDKDMLAWMKAGLAGEKWDDVATRPIAM